MYKIAEKHTTLALCALASLHAALTLTYALTRLYSYKASLLDIGTFEQALWNVVHHGIPLSTTNPPFTTQHWLGFHFSPLLIALIPFYALWPHPETLQLAQSLCFAFAALPLFYAALALHAKRAEAWICIILYWTNPLIISAALWDFHEIAFSTVLIAAALWAVCAKRFTSLICLLLLLLLTKEHYGISMAGFGLLWGARYKDWKRGGLLIAGGLSAAYAVLAVVMPFFHGGIHPMLENSQTHLSRYGWLSGTVTEKIHMFGILLLGDGGSQVTGVAYLLFLALSGLTFPLFALLYLTPAAADILANLLSANPMPRHIAAYHGAACIPVCIIAGLRGYQWLIHTLPASKKILQATALAIALVFPISGLSLFPFRIWELDAPRLTLGSASVQDINGIIGESPVSAQSNVGMFFANRSLIYPFPHTDNTDYAILHLFQPFSDGRQSRFGIPFGLETAAYTEALLIFVAREDWHIAYWHRPWLVMKRGKTMNDERAQRAEIRAVIQAMNDPTTRPAPQNP